ncbi:MAG: NnrS family protein [Stellaceae bacterium]
MSRIGDPEAIELTAEERRLRRARLPAVLDYAFRPMFLAAGSWAVIALALWLAMFFGYVQLPTRFDPLAWHVHEMLFGFVMAAVAGFLLTAIPNWTGRLPVRGLRLAALAGLWLLGRLACLISADLPTWLAVLADLAFPTALLAVAAREIIAGRNWRNLPMTAPLALFIIADLLMHLESLGFAVPIGLGWRLAVGAPIVLISVIGGRIIPSFTRNWLFKRKSPRLPSPQDMLDTAAVALLAAALILWAFLPDHRVTGALLIAAALLNAVRLGRWAGIASWPEPLLFILHIGYGWVALGTALLGLSIFNIGVPAASAIHALTAGATAVMILAVMPRVTLGHTGRELMANRATVAVFVLINAAAIIRVCASWHTEFMTILLLVAGACWIAAFGLFELIYGPMLLTRRSAS